MKSKTILLGFSLLIFSSFLSNGQAWKWGVEGKGSVANQNGGAVATDKKGDAYITGYYDPSIVFNKDTLKVPYQENMYLVKFDTNGNVIWAIQPGQGSDPNAESIGTTDHTDKSGNIYVTGYFQDTIYFGSNKLFNPVNLRIPNPFLVKYNSSGNVIWATRILAYLGAYGLSIATDNSNNVFVAGYYNDTTILIKYDSNGTQLWGRVSGWGSGINRGATADYVTADKWGNSYITGSFNQAAITFGKDTLTTNVKENGFLVKYDPSGNVLWARKPVAKAANDSANGGNGTTAVVTDISGNVYVAGTFQDTVVFGSYAFTSPPNESTMFFVKYDSNGNVLWAKASSGRYTSRSTSLAIDASNQIYLGGLAGGTMTFGGLTFQTQDSADFYSFIIKLDSSGNTLCGSILSEGAGILYLPVSVATNPSGRFVYLAATTMSGETVIAGQDTLVANNGGYTDYVARWQPCDIIEEGINKLPAQKENVSLFPNPNSGKFTIAFVGTQNFVSGTIEIYNMMGARVLKQVLRSAQDDKAIIDLTNQPNGVYLYRVISEDGSLIREGKVVIQK